VNERLLTARQVADLLGFAPGTIVDWAEAGKIPGFRIGGRLRFRPSEVEAWLEERRAPEEKRQPPLIGARPRASITDASHPAVRGGEDA
jgi:excisionase family DNA binding protein